MTKEYIEERKNTTEILIGEAYLVIPKTHPKSKDFRVKVSNVRMTMNVTTIGTHESQKVIDIEELIGGEIKGVFEGTPSKMTEILTLTDKLRSTGRRLINGFTTKEGS